MMDHKHLLGFSPPSLTRFIRILFFAIRKCIPICLSGHNNGRFLLSFRRLFIDSLSGDHPGCFTDYIALRDFFRMIRRFLFFLHRLVKSGQLLGIILKDQFVFKDRDNIDVLVKFQHLAIIFFRSLQRDRDCMEPRSRFCHEMGDRKTHRADTAGIQVRKRAGTQALIRNARDRKPKLAGFIRTDIFELQNTVDRGIR